MLDSLIRVTRRVKFEIVINFFFPHAQCSTSSVALHRAAFWRHWHPDLEIFLTWNEREYFFDSKPCQMCGISLSLSGMWDHSRLQTSRSKSVRIFFLSNHSYCRLQIHEKFVANQAETRVTNKQLFHLSMWQTDLGRSIIRFFVG